MVSLWTLSTTDKRMERFDAVTSNSPLDAAVSPDGRWVAYTVRAKGRAFVYVQPVPATGAKYQVSEGGHHPLWSPDGSELHYFPGANRLVGVRVSTQSAFSVSDPQPIARGFTANTSNDSGRNHDFTPDGHIIASLSAAEVPGNVTTAGQIEVVLNWLEELKARVPGK
jgi:Tol biopolymer transport system component